MELGQGALTFIAVMASILAIVALALGLVLARRLAEVATSSRRAAARDGGFAMDPREVGEVITRALQNVGLVRFDAFDDMGGRLSFAAALLDAEGSGIVFSSINGRSETRIYAKPVQRGASTINLSEEEEEAIRRALGASVRAR